MTWVKFHGELMEGAKRGLPRAVRFIYMELSHKARRGRGEIALPVGMSDAEALQDILGGNPKEVREAHAKLTSGPDPMVVFEGEEGSRRLVLPSWQRWNAGALEPAGASTQRSQKSRATADDEACNGDAAVMQRPLQVKATVDATGRNGRSSGDQIREDQKREDPPKPPSGARRRGRPSGAETSCPPSAATDEEVEAWLSNWNIPSVTERVWGDEVQTGLLDRCRSKGHAYIDWGAAWRTAAGFAVKHGRVAANPKRCMRSQIAEDAEAHRKARAGRAMPPGTRLVPDADVGGLFAGLGFGPVASGPPRLLPVGEEVE